MVSTGSCRRFVYILAACVALLASPGFGTPIVLKEYNAAGYTFANTPDTQLDGYGTSTAEKQYNFGGVGNYDNIYASARPYLVSFDLNAIPDKNLVVGVTSVTLRLYRTNYQFANTNYKVAQVAQDWVEGTGTSSASTCDGAQWFNRNAGTVVNWGE